MADLQRAARPSGEAGAPKGWAHRLLSLFSDVRAGEAASCLALALNVFLLLGSYYLLKTVREALILSESGATVKSYAAGGQALLLLGVVPLYGWLGSRVNRIRLLSAASLFFVLNLLVFAALGAAGVRIGVAFFIWVGIFNVFIVAQFWSFANDLYTEVQGKRLFPVIAVGGSVGAWAGAALARPLIKSLGPYGLMLAAAGGLLAALPLTWWVHRRDHVAGKGGTSRQGDRPLGTEGGFKLVLAQRYLLLIAVLTVLVNVVNSVGEFILGDLVEANATRLVATGAAAGLTKAQLIGQTYSDFFAWVNGVGLFAQAFLVSRIFKWIGVRGALFILPVIAMGTYGLILAVPALGAVRWGKILENSTDYSVQNTTRQGLFLITSREAKYKAKAAIDTFFWRAGDVLQSLVVWGGTALAFTVQAFAGLNLLLVGVWLLVAWLLFREHRRLSNEEAAPAPAPGTPRREPVTVPGS